MYYLTIKAFPNKSLGYINADGKITDKAVLLTSFEVDKFVREYSNKGHYLFTTERN